MKLQNKNIWLVGGGTGGHAAPILAIYKKLIKEHADFKISVFGVGSNEEKYFFAQIPEYRVIHSGKIHRYLTLKNILELGKMFLGFFQAVYYFFKDHPAVVFSKGGYASLPVIFVAKIFRVPYFFHESDIEMGKVNRLVAKSAKRIFVSYPADNYSYINNRTVIWTGPILKEDFIYDNNFDIKSFGFCDKKPVILVTGGSQGSISVTENFLKIAEDLLVDFNIIHQAGKFSVDFAKKFKSDLPENLKSGYFYVDFLTNVDGRDMMLEAINAADLVITRAGSTVIELALKSKPMVLIPWQHSAQNHQYKNAQFFFDRNSARMIIDQELTPTYMKNIIVELFENKNLLDEMSMNAQQLFPENGLEVVCESIVKEIEVI